MQREKGQAEGTCEEEDVATGEGGVHANAKVEAASTTRQTAS